MKTSTEQQGPDAEPPPPAAIAPAHNTFLTNAHPREAFLTGANARRVFCLLCAFGTVAALVACEPEYDPLTRSEVWHPDHSNRANLTMQVANPSDLVRGTGTTTGDGMLAAAAVERLRNDKLKKLPAADISQLSVSQAGSNNSAGGQ